MLFLLSIFVCILFWLIDLNHQLIIRLPNETTTTKKTSWQRFGIVIKKKKSPFSSLGCYNFACTKNTFLSITQRVKLLAVVSSFQLHFVQPLFPKLIVCSSLRVCLWAKPWRVKLMCREGLSSSEVQKLDSSLHRINHYPVDIDIIENNCVILWTEIYPVGSAMHLMSKLDQYFNLILLTKMYFSVWGLNP